MDKKRQFFLSTIEGAIDVTNPNDNVKGFLCLVRFGNNFHFLFSPFNSKTSIFQHVAIPTETLNDGEESSFIINCKDIYFIRADENDSLYIFLFPNNQSGSKNYIIPKTEYISFLQLLEQLLINGIAVPSKKNSLLFYKKCHYGLYSYLSPHLKLEYNKFTNLDNLWDDINTFFTKLMIHLDSSDTLPNDDNFPLNHAANASNERIFKRINKFIEELIEYKEITQEDLKDLFDENGKMKNSDEFRKRVYHSGIEKSILPDLLPFVFQVYSYDSTYEERKEIDKKRKEDLLIFNEQVDSRLPIQIKNCKKVTDDTRVISHDVARTDRNLPAFNNLNGTGSKILSKFLHSYSLFNQKLGYLQGMNDLFVPIIMSYIPYWSEDGSPIDSNGQLIDYSEKLPKIFWCFEAMLRNTKQLNLLADVTEECKNQAFKIFKILYKVSPIVAIWIKSKGLQDFLWCYSDFVLMFKRTYPNVLPIWLKFNCSDSPSNWMAYFTCAIILECFKKLSDLKDTSLTKMMDEFPRMIEGLQISRIGSIALWLFNEYQLPEDVEVEPDDVFEKFEFFEALCNKKN